MRVPQPLGTRGSLKWLQRVAAGAAPATEQAIIAKLRATSRLDWLSPRRDDDFAEYRDGTFLDQIGHSSLRPALKAFWPSRGPQWDGLARTDAGQVLLFEAKAHTGELRSGGCQASLASRQRIETALLATAHACATTAPRAWTEAYYQSANRLAHLHFLRRHGVDAYLVLMNFLSDTEMSGPLTVEEWQRAHGEAEAAMGLGQDHALSRYVLHVYPDVRHLGG